MSDAPTHCRCGRCGAHYAAPAFLDLTRLGTLAEGELSAFVSRWPNGLVVEVRACARCQGPIARLAPGATSGRAFE